MDDNEVDNNSTQIEQWLGGALTMVDFERKKPHIMTHQISESDESDRADQRAFRERIRRQVEFYLGDANLSRDRLFSHELEKRSDFGIPISLLLQCPRLKHLQTTEELLIRSVKKSDMVKLSNDGEAICRQHPPIQLSCREKRTLLVCGIPRWHEAPRVTESVDVAPVPTDESPDPSASSNGVVIEKFKWRLTDWLREVFSQFGEVLCINVPCFPSSEMLRGFAFVEFATSREAKTAAKHMTSSAENETWFVPPSNTDVDVTTLENAWKPRLAAKSAFNGQDMLARRYVWRCCTRRNKQIITAFRHLRLAGYRAPNPCDREYELITLGKSSPEARSSHLNECYGDPEVERLRVFRYSVWEFWKSNFYLWLQAWIARMRRKTEELSMDPQPNAASTSEANGDEITPVVNHLTSTIGDSVDLVQPMSLDFADPKPVEGFEGLPESFVPNTVVLLYWPTESVSMEKQGKHSLDNPDLIDFSSRPALSLPRRIRISLEHHLLSASGLLDSVAHFDPSPIELVLSEVSSILERDHLSESPDNSSHPVFIRMKTKVAADQLNEFVHSMRKTATPSCQWVGQVESYLLSGECERVYCKAIVSSRIGASERRRRSQKKRRHQKTRENDHPDDSVIVRPCVDLVRPALRDAERPKHIIFDS